MGDYLRHRALFLDYELLWRTVEIIFSLLLSILENKLWIKMKLIWNWINSKSLGEEGVEINVRLQLFKFFSRKKKENDLIKIFYSNFIENNYDTVIKSISFTRYFFKVNRERESANLLKKILTYMNKKHVDVFSPSSIKNSVSVRDFYRVVDFFGPFKCKACAANIP